MKYKLKVQILNDNIFFGPGIYELLKGIEKTGSIKLAASKMNLSYSKARHIIKTMEEEIAQPVITSIRGGKEGGTSSLTGVAKEYIIRYEAFVRELDTYASKIFNDYFK